MPSERFAFSPPRNVREHTINIILSPCLQKELSTKYFEPQRVDRLIEEDYPYMIEQMRRQVTEVIFSFIEKRFTALLEHDKTSAAHSIDVANLMWHFTEKLDLDPLVRLQYTVAALLHDIGKEGVPSSILQKPGPLDDDEFAKIKKHPFKGAAMVLSDMQQLPLNEMGQVDNLDWWKPIYDANLCHHIDWNGQGYPAGLVEGHEIPLVAQLVRVIDSCSAATMDRGHKPPLPISKVESEFSPLFDNNPSFRPELKDYFLDILPEPNTSRVQAIAA